MKRKPLTHLEVVLAASLVITCTPTAEADESSLDFSATGSSGGSMAGIKQNGILGWLLRGSWLTSSEYLV